MGDRSTERWKELKAVFTAALAVDDADRETFLAEACAGDDALREEVGELLTAYETSGPVDRLMEEMMAPMLARLDVQSSDVQSSDVQSSVEGQRVGPYEVLRELGRGGMSRVYRARDVRLGRFVALKFLSPDRYADETAKARFVQEAQAASTLDHPNICTIYDLGETDDGALFIAMACYEGQTLAEKIDEGPLPVEDSLDIARQVAGGLACAHEAGIVHRDVKPSNVMVTEGGRVKILDFGIAKLGGDAALTQTGTRIGTAAYMAPEQVRGERVDHRADLWALGVVLYEMLAGQRPFRGGSEAALIHAILTATPRPISALRPEVPAALEDVVQRALSKAPDERYRQADEVADALRAVRGEAPSSTAPVRMHSGVWRGRPALRSDDVPSMLTSFIGRAKEIARIETLLEKARLVTLTGPAGTGKTRLGLQVATRAADRFADGVRFVSLAPVTDPGRVASAIAQAMDEKQPAGAASPLDRLKRRLETENRLLILDNFEQVVAAAPVVADLLGACPFLRILVTSRVALHLSGEHEFPVRPLELPRADEVPDLEAARASSAVQLFVERAQAVNPRFALSSENVAAVAELCRRLDGLPLAIELAAARIKLFSPQAMLKRLDRRFDLLKSGPRDRPARHQTLRQAIAWSYDLLSEAHRQLFRRLAVFVGGCTMEAAEAVGSTGIETELDVIDGLSELVDHSLLRQEEGPDGESRFYMLETIRVYGLECLAEAGEKEAVQRAHAAFFLALAERAASELTGAEQADWFDRLEVEYDNLRAALHWAETHDEGEIGLRLGAALWRFWLVRGHLLEGRQWLERILAMPAGGGLEAVRARVLNGIGTLAHNQGDNQEARAFLKESLALWRHLDDESGQATVLNSLAWVACEISALDEARVLAEEALALCRELGEKRGMALALNNLGWVANYRGEYRVAKVFHQGSLNLRRELEDQRGIAFALTNLAWAETYHGRYDRASALLQEALDVHQVVKDDVLLVWTLLNKAVVAQCQANYDRAAALLDESLSIWREGSNKSLRAWALGALGSVQLDRGDLDRAEARLRESLDLWDAIGCPWGQAGVFFEQGRLDRARGDRACAVEQYQRSWSLRHEIGDRRGMAECLEEMAQIALAREKPAPATQMLAGAWALRREIEAPLPLHRRAGHRRLLEDLRDRLGAEAFDATWVQGTTVPPEEAIGLVDA